jgi:hypothetical protein
MSLSWKLGYFLGHLSICLRAFIFLFLPYSHHYQTAGGAVGHTGEEDPDQLLLTAYWAGKWAGSFASSGLMYISVIHHPHCILGFPRTTINQCFRPPPFPIRFASAEVLWPSRYLREIFP